MTRDWLWDRKIATRKARDILKRPEHLKFLSLAALLLARKNVPREVFKNWLDPLDFCRNWSQIKREMRKDTWNHPRIIFWQAVYEKVKERYSQKGIVVIQRQQTRKPLDEFCKLVGEKIRARRKEMGLTQEDLSNRLKISQQMISRIETGEENVSLLTLKQLAKGLGATVDLVLKRGID